MGNNQKTSHLDTISAALGRRGLYKKYATYLPSPQYVQQIINATNQGQIKEVSRRIMRSEDILTELMDDLSLEDKEWYMEVIKSLKFAVASWRPN